MLTSLTFDFTRSAVTLSNSSLKTTLFSWNENESGIGLTSTRNHVFYVISVSWGIYNRIVIRISVKLLCVTVDSYTALTLFLVSVHVILG